MDNDYYAGFFSDLSYQYKQNDPCQKSEIAKFLKLVVTIQKYYFEVDVAPMKVIEYKKSLYNGLTVSYKKLIDDLIVKYEKFPETRLELLNELLAEGGKHLEKKNIRLDKKFVPSFYVIKLRRMYELTDILPTIGVFDNYVDAVHFARTILPTADFEQDVLFSTQVVGHGLRLDINRCQMNKQKIFL